MTQRLQELEGWLRAGCGLAGLELVPASGDASFRRYYRVRLGGRSLIAMDAPPERESCARYLDIAGRFAQIGLRVPEVYHQDLERGFLLIEDLGTALYLDRLNEQNADRLYGDALGALMVIQACGPRDGLPVYDRMLLERELAIFPEWLLGHHLGLSLSVSERAVLAQVFEQLVANALAQPRVCVHRDFHSRNLLVTAPPSPGILDFQDAVVGPVTYDLVSLLRDCYIRWPRSRVEDWAAGYFELAVQSGVLREEHEAQFMRWLDLMGVQRQLKAVGIFARLYRRDGKPGYLGDIPRTLEYILELAPEYPELADLAALMEARVLPLLSKPAEAAIRSTA